MGDEAFVNLLTNFNGDFIWGQRNMEFRDMTISCAQRGEVIGIWHINDFWEPLGPM